MHFTQTVSACLLAFAGLSSAIQAPHIAGPIPADHILWGEEGAPTTLAKRQATTNTALTAAVTGSTQSVSAASSTRTPDPSCTNSPTNRACWSNGYSVVTDFDAKWPTTGKTRTYNLEITNTTCAPDGTNSHICMLINNQYPGPTIFADWGDTISVTVKNSMKDNGTSIHWHGIRQLNTNTQDGVNGITECPLAPGDTKTYTFKATQFGTTWYHSHYSAQYGNGIVGAIVINGPASTNYDIDLGPYLVNDWYYKTADQMNAIIDNNLQNAAGPPPSDNILVNGTNKSPDGSAGKYSTVTGLIPGKKYRLRLINAAVDAQIRVSLDNHPFTVITSDLVPIKPISKQWVLLGIGQRYDVVFTANATAGNYWFRAEVATDCFSASNFYGRGVFSYQGVTSGTPSSTAYTIPSVCKDESPLVPWVPNVVPNSTFVTQAQNLNVDLGVEQVTTNGQNIVVWGVNLTAIDVDWKKPVLQYVVEKNTSYPASENLIEIPTSGVWTYWIVQETPGTVVPIPHPIHLHGHDFYVLGQGTGTFNKATDIGNLTFANPTRRDVAFLPAQGWLVIAFPADNPGAWLMHCHIAWHVSEGLGVQFLETKDSITLPDAAWQKTCTNYNNFYNGPHAYNKTDSGLKKRFVDNTWLDSASAPQLGPRSFGARQPNLM